MAVTANITSKNQITLLAKVRRSLGVRTGDKMDFNRNATSSFELRAGTEVLTDLVGALKADVSVCTDNMVSRKRVTRWQRGRGMLGIDTNILLRIILAGAAGERDAADDSLTACIQYPGNFSDQLIGTIDKPQGCRTTLSVDKAASRSPQFFELQR